MKPLRSEQAYMSVLTPYVPVFSILPLFNYAKLTFCLIGYFKKKGLLFTSPRKNILRLLPAMVPE